MQKHDISEAQILKEIPPFDVLDTHDFQFAFEQMSAFYLSQASREEIIQSGRSLLYLVRSGTYDLVSPEGKALERLERGDLFGFPSLLSGRVAKNQIAVIQPGIVWTWPEAAFHQLRKRCPEFERYFIDAHKRRLLQEHYLAPHSPPSDIKTEQSRQDWTAMRLEEALQQGVLKKQPRVSPETWVHEVAQQMTAQKSSCALVIEDERLVGIITDRDMRERVVAMQLTGFVKAEAVMTQEPKILQASDTLFDALTLMGVWNLHHIPVLNEQQALLGVFTLHDLMRYQQSEPVALLRALHQSENYQALLTVAAQMPTYLQNFMKNLPESGRGTVLIGRYIASLSDTLTRKLIGFYKADAGPAPVPFAWVAFESQARLDQTPDSEQSNGIILEDSATIKDKQWFQKMAVYVCNGLAACGVPFSSHDILAKSAAGCLTLSEWQNQCKVWTLQTKNKEALLISMLKADSRCVVGQTELHQKFRRWLAGLATHPQYLSRVARFINHQKVPLGLFYRLRSGSNELTDYLDLKHTGIAILNHIIRLYAFAASLEMANSIQRLEALEAGGWINREEKENLVEAWYFLSDLRLSAQISQLETADRPLHTINPAHLSTLQRRQLKAVFRVIKEAKQRVLYQFGRVL